MAAVLSVLSILTLILRKSSRVISCGLNCSCGGSEGEGEDGGDGEERREEDGCEEDGREKKYFAKAGDCFARRLINEDDSSMLSCPSVSTADELDDALLLLRLSTD